ncbi:ATP-dependent DNA helicase recQ [Pseudomassariella vexata]|uniref:DNA 3'-5' helicase n=1 Tax=Pseudomassariella vexata TaxID=1141098 RepID=A0A1Y2DQT7_9PEZI|nr:ATP-dependent DNA helicase recQ [Pseudomassariella vexata]ORY61587.1 ATP-dependent DNA helicase recQ [Pseudomassariella vexata]
MDEYDSGDDLFADVNTDALVHSNKRPGSTDAKCSGEEANSSKRVKIEHAINDANLAAIARKILRDRFGLDAFRHEQEKAIQSILRGQNTLVIFPTGAGKSLCYQIPALAFEHIDEDNLIMRPEGPGITLVVSPLIALMKDQTDALKRRGIPAECSDSTKTYEQQQQISGDIRAGRLRLLYCSPEKLNNEGFVESMKYVPGGVRLLAIDEAHCISEWGHSFRPDYLMVARFAEEIKAEKVICLTATATPRVADDVCKAFKVDESNVFRTSPYRPNLLLEAQATKTKQDKYPLLFKFLEENPGSTLVYVTLQKQAEALAQDLKEQGFDATHFHAGMKVAEKMAIQDRFMSSKVRIVVATIAFGMGIDKSDIRNIVHWDLSSTVEEYSQQIGRAGRDGLPSHCMLYMCHEDFYIRENFARGDLPSRQSLRGLLRDIFRRKVISAAEGNILKLSHYGLSDTYDIRAAPLTIILATLELRYGLMRAIAPEYSKYEFEDMGGYSTVARRDRSREAQAIFKHANKINKWYRVDVIAMLAETGLLRADVIRLLHKWNDTGIILLKTAGVEHRYRILRPLPRTDAQIERIVESLHADMEAREEDALARTQHVAHLITASKCYSLALAEHFGMGLPDGKRACGHCTYCLTKQPVVLPPNPPVAVDLAGIKNVLQSCRVRDDPRFLARVAFGIKSPRIIQLKLDKYPVFGSLADHEFKVRIHVVYH